MTPPAPTTTVYPIGQHRARLIENIGRDHWVYEGIPEKGHANHTLNGSAQVIAVYFFKWDGIPRDVQAQMVSSHALVHRKTLAEAFEYCSTHDHAIPCADVRLKTHDDREIK
jgi:hypothetical protein